MQTHTSNKIAASTVAAVSAQNASQPARSQDEVEQPTPDIAAQLGAVAYGHSFANAGVTPAPQGVIQPKLAIGAAARTSEDGAAAPDAQIANAEAEGEMDSAARNGATQLAPVPLPGGQHHVVLLEVNGQLRLGMRSEFTTIAQMVELMTSAQSTLSAGQKQNVREIGRDAGAMESHLALLKQKFDARVIKERSARSQATKQTASEYGPVRNRINMRSPHYDDYITAKAAAGEAWDKLFSYQQQALARAKDQIIELWDIGSDFLPTNLMPAGEIFRDKDFAGDLAQYIYHTGAENDPIPIVWYKAPTDYPKLRLGGKTVINFGVGFKLDTQNFNLAPSNRPKLDWKIQKVAHNETREGQRGLNDLLLFHDVEVEKGGNFVMPALGDRHQFDGDHVKDLGFGGLDNASNYWPLDSTINRRAFKGYNAHYIIHYKDSATGVHRSRAIGGLIGKWFIVKGFLAPADGPVPQLGTAAGGTSRH
jgi:hypothetical protein